MATLRLIVDASGAKRGYREAEQAGDKFKRGARGVETQTGRVRGSFDRLKTSAFALRGAFAAIGIAVLARQFITVTDSMKQMESQLRLVTDGEVQLNRAFDQTIALANETRSGLDSTVTLFTRLTRATESLGLSQNEVLGVTSTINKAFQVSGASATEAAAATIQLSQGLAAGALRGEEFNSVNEQAPRIMGAIADSLNVTRGELREMAFEGKLTAEVVVNALRSTSEQGQQIAREFEDVERTVSQSWTVMGNNLSVLVGEMDSASGITGSLIGVIDELGESFDEMNRLVKATKQPMDEAGQAMGDLKEDTFDMSEAIIRSMAEVVDVFRTSFATISAGFSVLGKTLGAGGAQIVAILQGRFGDVTRIGEAWQDDMKGIFEGVGDFDTSKWRDALEEIREAADTDEAVSKMEKLADSIQGTIPGFRGMERSASDAADSTDNVGDSAGDTEKDLTSLANVIGRSVNPALDDMRESGREAMEQFDRFADAILSQTPIAGAKLATLDETIQAIESDTGEAGDTALVTFRSMEQIAEDTASGIRDSWVDTFDQLFRGQIDSVKGFVSSVKDLFIRMIAEISASLVASQIFKFFGGGGGFSLPNLGDLFGGGGDGAMNLASIGASLKGGAGKIAGALGLTGAASSGAVATPIAAAGGAIAPTAVLTGGAIEAGTGLAASAGGAVSTGAAGGGAAAAGGGLSSAIAAAAPAAAVLAAPIVLSKLAGEGNVDKLAAQAGKSLQGAQLQPGGAGTQIGAQGGFGVATGPNAGFVAATEAARNMSKAIVALDDNTRVFKDVTMRDMVEITSQAEAKFEDLKRRGASMFADLGVGAAQMGKHLQDGVIDQSEKAALGIEHIGAVIENPKTGMKELGDLSVSQFDRITEAIKNGELRLSALQGETKLSNREMRLLGDIGVGAHGKIVGAIANAEGRERRFGNEANKVFQAIGNDARESAGMFSESFNTAANDAANGISNFARRTSGDLANVSRSAGDVARSLSSIPRNVSVNVRGNVKGPGEFQRAEHGGVLSGPRSGYLAELHGTEAVIPLKNGSVPVEIQGGGQSQPMVVNINQTINGGNPEDIARATRREFQRVANEFPIR